MHTRPALLLLITGTLLGINFPLGELASRAGFAPGLWSWFVMAGGTVLLLPMLLIEYVTSKASPTQVDRHNPKFATLVFFMIASVVSIVLPFVLVQQSIPHLGSGYTGLMFTLSPILTMLFGALVRLRIPGALGISGILLGLLGAVLIAVHRGELGNPAEPAWLLIGLCIPVSLAVGNVYRSVAWPGNASPTFLATGLLGFAALLYLPVVLVTKPAGIATPTALALYFALAFAKYPGLLIGQAILSASLYYFHLRLQRAGGPIYLSQISYIGAMVGLAAGVGLLGEQYQFLTWVGSGLIVFGTLLTTAELRRAT